MGALFTKCFSKKTRKEIEEIIEVVDDTMETIDHVIKNLQKEIDNTPNDE
tara:strand:+ start:1237 stop:1386 length:150 start_codon:yes stop_codon:yes gene_type:complete